MKIEQLVCIEENKKGLSYEFLISVFRLHTKYDEMNIVFWHDQKRLTIRIWYVWHSQHLYRTTQNNPDILVNVLRNG